VRRHRPVSLLPLSLSFNFLQADGSSVLQVLSFVRVINVILVPLTYASQVIDLYYTSM
jgi:hypothetical protein